MSDHGDATEAGAPAWKRWLPLALLIVAVGGVGALLLRPDGDESETPIVETTPPAFDILPIDTREFPRLRRMPERSPEPLEPVAEATPPPFQRPASQIEPPVEQEAAPAEEEPAAAPVEQVRPPMEWLARSRVPRGPEPLQETGSFQERGPLRQQGAIFNDSRPVSGPIGAALAAVLAAEGGQAGGNIGGEGDPVRRVGMKRPDGRVIEVRIGRDGRQAGQWIRRWHAGASQQRAALNGGGPLSDPASEALAAERGEAPDEAAAREGVEVRRVGVMRPDGRVIEGRITRDGRQAGQLIRRWLAGATHQDERWETAFAPATDRIFDEILRASGLAGISLGGRRFGDPIALEYALVQNYTGREPLFFTGCPGPVCELRESRFVPPDIYVRYVAFPQDLSPFRASASAGELAAVNAASNAAARAVANAAASPGAVPPGLDLRVPDRRHPPSSALVQSRLGAEFFDFSMAAERRRLASLRAVEIGPHQYDISPPLRFVRTSFDFTDIARWRFRHSSSLGDVRRFYGPIYGSLNGALHGALLPAGGE